MVADDLIKSILIKNQSDNLPEDCLVKSNFLSLYENFQSIDYMKDRAILSTKNEYVDMLNDRIIKQLPGEGKKFYSFDEAVDDRNHHYQQEFLSVATKWTTTPQADIFAITTNVKPSINYITRHNKPDTRREITLMNISGMLMCATLFGDLATNEGSILEEEIKYKPIIALSDFKISIYQGTSISSQIISTLCINPKIELASELREWFQLEEAAKAKGSPSMLFKNAKEIHISDIMHTSQNSIQAQYCTFKAKITTILNRLEPWFYACKGCDKKVDTDVSKECLNDKYHRIINDPLPMYLVKILMENGTDNTRVTLFDAAETLIRCKAEKFITEKKYKNNHSPYFQKFVLNIEKTFKFLVKLDEKTKDERGEGLNSSSADILVAELLFTPI
ncbi:replication protein A 70 kDa DNA-binding subunit B-like [Asparagus officinalis]|uniref:replication protein A 70 kDa DNA-binding subunit B-like n=1 Tax=Asparagus officinalis TaxID=4686 RepID=UPI00098E0AB2|nr:replication protein A 70 kDa DNA-binding subunit B-like [Asparagus officinalis]